MKRGVWTGILVLLLLASFIYAEDETVQPQGNMYAVRFNSFSLNDLQTEISAAGAYDVENAEKYTNLISAVSESKPSGYLLGVIPNSYTFYLTLDQYKTLESVVKSSTQSKNLEKKIVVTPPTKETSLLPGSASPGYDYKTASYPNQGAVCMLS